MNRRSVLIMLGLGLISVGWVFWTSEVSTPRSVLAHAVQPAVPGREPLPSGTVEHGAIVQSEPKENPFVAPAAQSMALAREQGDPRSPPIKRRADTAEPPKAADLESGDAFNAYEQRMSMKTYQNFIQAADAEIPKIQAQIQQGQSMGISPDRLAVGQEKLQRLQNMRAQLLAQHPELQP